MIPCRECSADSETGRCDSCKQVKLQSLQLMSDRERWLRLQEDVNSWARTNFGHTASKHPMFGGVEIRSLAPLLGVFEETGETHNAENVVEWRDGIGDIGIYLLDFCAQEHLQLADYMPDGRYYVPKTATVLTLFPLLARVAHIVLKRHQGIRGYGDDGKYFADIGQALRDVCAHICYVVNRDDSQRFLDLVEETWENVQLRNWVKNQQTGVAAV